MDAAVLALITGGRLAAAVQGHDPVPAARAHVGLGLDPVPRGRSTTASPAPGHTLKCKRNTALKYMTNKCIFLSGQICTGPLGSNHPCVAVDTEWPF